jgi:hypothetical protein
MCVKPLKYALCPWKYLAHFTVVASLVTLLRLHSLCNIKRAASPSTFSSKEEKTLTFPTDSSDTHHSQQESSSSVANNG